ncbi:MAG: amidase [Alphaproteobacteria bacterium]|jgi:aspartyl-tRNA(Asn)/glutamyl-tRNA(Gln) amidotransferase subunit A
MSLPTSADDLCFTPASEVVPLVRSKQLSPVELCEAVLARIDRLEPQLNAFATLTADRAMADARAVEAKIMKGEAVGPLAGVTVTIKDLAVTADVPTERGSHVMKGYISDTDAPMITRLKNAGAVVLGKTTTSELGWKGVSQSPLTGITHNPWGHGMNAGASSAGAGVGAAAGYGALHQGSDGAGSVRMPAHFCGIYGLKPSYGRVPNWPQSNTDQVSHVGPMTRTVLDSAMMLKVMSGPHDWDHYSLESPPDDYPSRLKAGIKGLRVAYSPDLGHARVDPEVAELVAAAVKAFEEMGCIVEQPTLPKEVLDGPELVRFFWSVHETALYTQYLPEFESRMDPGLVACIRSGEGYSATDYMTNRGRKLAYNEAWHKFFNDYDLLLTPAVSVAAFPADKLMPDHWPTHEWDWVQWAEFSYPFNFTGQPAASIPCGFTKAGLPVGLQIVGPRFNDTLVLQASAAFEQARPWADKRPSL